MTIQKHNRLTSDELLWQGMGSLVGSLSLRSLDTAITSQMMAHVIYQIFSRRRHAKTDRFKKCRTRIIGSNRECPKQIKNTKKTI